MPEKLSISNSKLKVVLACEMKYVYKYVQGLRLKRKPLPLKLGSWVHALIDAKYKLGDWRPTQESLVRGYDKLWDEEKALYGDLPAQTQLIMEGYDWYWRGDSEEWKFHKTEEKVKLPIGKNWTYTGIIDVVAENEEGIWLWDHKTAKGAFASGDYRTIDSQSAFYDWVYEKLTGIKPVGFLFNYIRTKTPTEPFFLKRGGITTRQLDTNYFTVAKWIKRNGLDLRDKRFRPMLENARARDNLFFDRVFIPRPDYLIKNILEDLRIVLPRIRELHEGRRPVRNLSRDCKWCEMKDICLVELIGGDSTLVRKHQFTTEPEDNDGIEEIEDSVVFTEE